VKEELDEHEKAINVRRAIKMEKVIYYGASFLTRVGLSMVVFPDVWRTAPADVVLHPAVS
jgi:hypothetical protein